jgi:hypothetical protein
MPSGIVSIANKPGYWVVPSSDGKRSYEVHVHARQCTCADWTHRQSRRAGECKHVLAVLAHLEQQNACPQCGGRGFYVTRFHYASGSEPLPCSCCDGTGRRESADPNLLELADQHRRETTLKELFA